MVAGFGGVALLAVGYRKQAVTEDEHQLALGKDERETVQRSLSEADRSTFWFAQFDADAELRGGTTLPETHIRYRPSR
ncbi:hypothetical protein AB0F91_03880 [Amycolatopsis sp. NPDC023774]|uniref:hypothetical protein n=1 Tax=Amycolatopsis sp. NPDC023774 TaxID=3155015 RepID=UPI0033C94F10